MSKYNPLREALEHAGSDPVEFRFEEIAQLVGGLPPSAYRYREWWANEQTGTHVQARAWRAAGRRVEALDLPGRRVLFGARQQAAGGG
jgi:hypothetical protein